MPVWVGRKVLVPGSGEGRSGTILPGKVCRAVGRLRSLGTAQYARYPCPPCPPAAHGTPAALARPGAGQAQ